MVGDNDDMAPEATKRIPGSRHEVLVATARGESIRGWVENLNLSSGVVRIFAESGPRTTASRSVALDVIKTIGFVRSEPHGGTAVQGFPRSARLVTVRFHDGETMRGVSQDTSGGRYGMFLVPVGSQWFDRVFVPTVAIAELASVQPLGKVLTGKKMVTREDVDRAVERQEARRKERLGDVLVRTKVISDDQLQQGLASQDETRSQRIGEILVARGFITQAELEEAIAAQHRQRNMRLGEVMVEMGIATHKMIGLALAIQYSLPFLDVSTQVIDPSVRAVMSAHTAREWSVIPLSQQEDGVTVAIADPTVSAPIEQLRFESGRAVIEVVGLERDIQRAIDVLYGPATGGAEPG